MDSVYKKLDDQHNNCRGGKCDRKFKEKTGHQGGKEKTGHQGGKGCFSHRAKRCIVLGAVAFTLVIFTFLCVNKKSMRHRKMYERLSEAHNSAIERNLSGE